MKYIITEEVKSGNKVSKHIDVTDFFFVLIYVGISFALMSLVNSRLKVLYMIFSFFIAIFLTSRSYFNKKRRNYESIILLLKNDHEVYRPFQEALHEEEK